MRSLLHCPSSTKTRVAFEVKGAGLSFMAFHFSTLGLSLVNNQGTRTNINDKKEGYQDIS
jgi:hypothetical protein